MPDNPIVPPLGKAVTEFKTPDQTVVFVTILVNRDDPAYVQNAPVKRGTLYKDIVGGDERLSTTHPLLYFCGERKFQLSDQYVLWDWSTDEHAHSSYNANITYELEAAGFPVFTRVYTIRRDEYEQAPTIAIGSTLDALIGVTIVDGGQDYTYVTGEIVGKDATVEFVVSDGVIISGVVTNEGAGVVAGDFIIVTGDGLGASVIPMVQPTSAVLTSQKKEELPDDNPWSNEFVKVTRVYQTLPGPTIHSTQIHVDGGVVDVATTAKVASTIVSGETLVGTVWTMTTKKQEDNAYVGQEIVSTRTVPGNPIKSTTIDAAGDIVTETRTLVAGPPTLVTTITTAGGVYTKTFAEPLSERLTFGEEASDLVSWKIVQNKLTQNTLDTYSAEIPDLLPEEFRPEVPVTTHEETLIGVATAITLPLALGVLFESKNQIDFNTYRYTIRGRTAISLPQTIRNKEITSEFGGGDVNRDLTLNLYNSLSLDEGLTVLSCNIKKIDDQTNGLSVKTTRQLNDDHWPELFGTHVDEKYGLQVDITRQTVDPLTSFPSPPTDLGTIVEYRPHDKWKTIQITSTIDLDNLGDLNTQYPGSMIHSFPPELVVSDTEPVINWAEASCDCAESFASSLIANLNQYTGIVTTRITEDFVTDPNATFPVSAITQFFPEAHVFGFAFASVCGCGEGAVLRAISPEFHIPLCLHDVMTLCVGGGAACAGAPYSWTFAATSPAVLPHGSYITLGSRIERWRFGVFHRVFTEVLVP